MTLFTKEQIFLVTGASSGIGEEVALHLNREGATVIAIARNEKRLECMKSKSMHPENMYLEIRDLTVDIENLPRYVKELKEKYGKLQGLAYCAGIVEVKPLQMLDLSEMKHLFDINYFAPIFMAKGFADRRNNIGKGASAVFISSISAFMSSRGMATYAGSKAGLAASIKAIGRELAPSGVRFNCISPSDIKTPMTSGVSGIMEKKLPLYPMGLGDVEDVSNLVMFLLSNKSKWITTQNYIVDCGFM